MSCGGIVEKNERNSEGLGFVCFVGYDKELGFYFKG